MKNTQNHRRGSSPHQEKEIGFITNQIELSFSDRQQEMTTKSIVRKTSRHEKPTEPPAIGAVDSATI